MKFYAHSAVDERGRPLLESSGKWQPLSVHLRQVAALARRFAEPLGLAAEAELAGLLHDLGKYAARFQQRLRDPRIHGINHWAAGAYEANRRRCRIADYAIDGHHTGLPSFSSLKATLEAMQVPDRARELTGCQELVPQLLERFHADGLSLPEPPAAPTGRKDRFAAALRARLLFSCLVDADFLDTEQHFDPASAAQRQAPALQEETAMEHLRQQLAGLQRACPDGVVRRTRTRLLEDCLDKAAKPPGLFTLTAPTGSGKTLASLAFALKHVITHNAALPADHPNRLRRIIVVIPYTSIIEQTARVYRELFEPIFGADFVLEHHGAVDLEADCPEGDRDREEESMQRARLATENWASPLIVTTTVQFFESLFAHKPAACRKLHNIARSVVLFDEVQTLPAPLLPSLLSAVRLLVKDYGVTAVFMTATQPAFESVGHVITGGWAPRRVESDANALAETLRRTRIELPERGASLSWAEVAERMTCHSQALCVVNTTGDARELFRLLPAGDRFHLSARLCPAHRHGKLTQIRCLLQDGRPCRLVSTQLIEAGVDVDFPVAFRALGPLDSIIQTAGRCNREGRRPEPCPVIVFRPEKGSLPPGAYRIAAEKTEEFLNRHPDAAQRLHEPDFYARYFAELYPLVGRESAEADPVFAASSRFDFPEAEAQCRIVGDETRSVLVRWGQGEQLIEKLRRQKHLSPSEWRRVQRFSINLYQGEFLQAKSRGYVVEVIEGVWYWNSQYDEDLGACHAEAGDLCL